MKTRLSLSVCEQTSVSTSQPCCRDLNAVFIWRGHDDLLIERPLQTTIFALSILPLVLLNLGLFLLATHSTFCYAACVYFKFCLGDHVAS